MPGIDKKFRIWINRLSGKVGGLFCARIVLSSGDSGFVDCSCETASSLGNVSLMKPYSAGIKYAGGKPLSFWLRA